MTPIYIEGSTVRRGEASQKRSLAWHFSESGGCPRPSSFSAKTFDKPVGDFSDQSEMDDRLHFLSVHILGGRLR
jgi:hypothetical protein